MPAFAGIPTTGGALPLDVITTVCNIGTLAVLVAGALAAVIQMRHVRAGNELQAVLAIERGFAESELQVAFLYVQNELPQHITRSAYRRELVARGFIDARAHPEMAVCNWFNDIGTMIAGGFINEDVFFASFARLVHYYWQLLVPVIALLRRERGDDQYANFEFLAYRAQRWLARRVTEPRTARAHRMPIHDPWSERNG